MDSVGIVIQARVGSTRLPNKILLPFYDGLTILELILRRLSSSFPDLPIVIATSTNRENDLIEDLASKMHVKIFRGSESDVLNRFINAAEQYQLKYCIRVCADNPFLSMHFIKSLLQSAQTNIDYLSHQLTDNGIPVIKSHLGLFAEFVRVEALKKVANLTTDKLYREHVTNFVYANKDLFKVDLLPLPKDMHPYEKKLRFTVDTKEDFLTAQFIFSQLDIDKNLSFDYDQLLQVIRQNPLLQQQMSIQIKQNQK